MSGRFCSPWAKSEGGTPFYGELGRKIRDVFGAYIVGAFNMNVSGLMTDYGMKFSDGISSNHETGDIAGNIETKFASSEQNIIFGQKWSSNNDLTAEFFLIDFCQGAQAKLVGTMNTKTHKKMLVVGTDCRNDTVALNLAAEFRNLQPTVRGALAAGYKNISLGYFTHFTSENTNFDTHDFKASYDGPEFSLLAALENEFNVISASFQSALIENVDGALELKYTKGGDDDGILATLGVKYAIDEDHVLRWKVNSKAIIGLSLVQRINDSTAVNLSALVEGRDVLHGKHKLGFGLNIQV